MKKNLFLVICLFTLTAGQTTAQAAFEWRGPPLPPNMGAAGGFPAPIGAEGGVAAAPVAPVEEILSIEEISLPRHSGTSMPGAYHGFGTDIPLGLAVGQIVPSDLEVDFGTGIDLERRVSWRGDGHWGSTLARVLEGQGLVHDVIGGAVKIFPRRDRMEHREAAPQPVLTLPGHASAARAPERAPRHVGGQAMPQGMTGMTGMTNMTQAASWGMAPVPVVPAERTQGAGASYAGGYGGAKQSVIPQSVLSQPGARAAGVTGPWTAGPRETLRQTLTQWAAAAGVEIYWATDYDFRLRQPVALEGSFEQAVGTLLESFRKTEPRPYGELKRNTAGGRVLIVQTYGAG